MSRTTAIASLLRRGRCHLVGAPTTLRARRRAPWPSSVDASLSETTLSVRVPFPRDDLAVGVERVNSSVSLRCGDRAKTPQSAQRRGRQRPSFPTR